MEVKIKQYKIRKSGKRGLTITVPQVWVLDNKLSAGDMIVFFRTENDDLVLKIKK